MEFAAVFGALVLFCIYCIKSFIMALNDAVYLHQQETVTILEATFMAIRLIGWSFAFVAATLATCGYLAWFFTLST